VVEVEDGKGHAEQKQKGAAGEEKVVKGGSAKG
jgi:hypothetical protein